ncbi:MAG: hypothetical protein MUP76_10635, partial [Acidimicrobiia bacterium]|nr:hypothetical protein [Acidimicrobiia bacterium]
MRDATPGSEGGHQPARHRSGGEGGLLEVGDRRVVRLLHRHIFGDVPGQRGAILPRGHPVRLQAGGAEPGGDGGPGQGPQVAEGSDPQPTEGGNDAVHPQRPHVEVGQEG